MDTHCHGIDQLINSLDVWERSLIRTYRTPDFAHPRSDKLIIDDLLVALGAVFESVGFQVAGYEVAESRPHQLHIAGVGVVFELRIAFLVALWGAVHGAGCGWLLV